MQMLASAVLMLKSNSGSNEPTVPLMAREETDYSALRVGILTGELPASSSVTTVITEWGGAVRLCVTQMPRGMKSREHSPIS